MPLTIKVATTGIKVNNDYLVLKQGKTFGLSATVTPAEANQTVAYSFLDDRIATVSNAGVVTAKNVGNTAIIISNGESSVAVSVIVNQETVSTNEELQTDPSGSEEKDYAKTVSATEIEKIDSGNLHYLYATGKTLNITGDGYRIEIDGKNIVNYENEFYTDIKLKEDDNGISFCLNQGKSLCGAVRLQLDNLEEKYLYLYNQSKDKYDFIKTDSIDELELTTPGEYRITNQRIMEDSNVLLVIVMVGGIAVAVGAYVVVKKRYWFW